MSLLIHLYNWIEIYSIALVWVVLPLFFFAIGLILHSQFGMEWVTLRRSLIAPAKENLSVGNNLEGQDSERSSSVESEETNGKD